MTAERVFQRSSLVFCCVLLGVLPCAGGELVAESESIADVIFAVRPFGADPHYYANFGYYCSDPDEKAYPQGGQLCRLNLQTGDVTVLLDAPAGGVRDPQMHYDGTKLLFSYRKPNEEHFHLFEINANGASAVDRRSV
jgi:hypothetical protein